MAATVELTESEAAKIGLGVREEVMGRGSARVVVALKHPTSRRSNLTKGEIASMQSNVLSSIKDDYSSIREYSAVPAMAGVVHSQACIDMLVLNPNVEKVDLDVGGTGELESSVPVINADERHSLGNTGSGVVVAVIDSGLDTDHSNLADRLVAEACFADSDFAVNGIGNCPDGSDNQIGPGAAEDDAGHGTHVTGIVASNGSQGGVGVAPDVQFVAVKVTNGPSFRGRFLSFSQVIAGLDYIIDHPELNIRIINMSLGTDLLYAGECDDGTSFNMAGAAAINRLRENGVVAFASAGNRGSSTEMPSPACLRNVIAVGASDDNDNPASFTNSNDSTDIFAPGVDVISSGLRNSLISVSGTSMASPHAAGCAALLIERGEASTPQQIEDRLKSSDVMVTVSGNGLSFPRIDCSPPHSTDNNEVEIAIKPYKAKNKVKLIEGRAKKVFVAILGSSIFNVTDVDEDSVRFGPGRAAPLLRGRRRDTNSDGFKDFNFRFNVKESGVYVGLEEACLSGQTKSSRQFSGCDSITVVRIEKTD